MKSYNAPLHKCHNNRDLFSFGETSVSSSEIPTHQPVEEFVFNRLRIGLMRAHEKWALYGSEVIKSLVASDSDKNKYHTDSTDANRNFPFSKLVEILPFKVVIFHPKDPFLRTHNKWFKKTMQTTSSFTYSILLWPNSEPCTSFLLFWLKIVFGTLPKVHCNSSNVHTIQVHKSGPQKTFIELILSFFKNILFDVIILITSSKLSFFFFFCM